MNFKFSTIVLMVLFLFTASANASPEYDRVYQLETLGWLKPYDNVDGIFNDYIDEVFTKYFQKQSRFIVHKTPGLDETMGNSKVPYYELIRTPEVLRKVAQRFKVESLIRTKIAKEGETYRFSLEWVYAPKGDVLAKFEFRYIDPGKEKGLEESDLPNALNKALDELIARLPFLGQVSGVEGSIITVNIGRNQHIHDKEILIIDTLQAVKRHPIDGTIEEWRWQEVGKAQVTQVEDSMVFAKVIETGTNQNIERFQKIRSILAAPPEIHEGNENFEEGKLENDLPRLGWIAGGLGLGTYTREVSANSGTTGRTGGGYLGSFEMEGTLWLNSRWLAQLSLGATTLRFNPKDILTGSELRTTYNGSSTQVRVAGGYCLFPAKTIFDPIGWVHMGYRYTSYSLPSQATDLVGSSSFGSLFVGLGGDMPISREFSAQMGFDIGILRSATETFPVFGQVGSSSDLMLSLAGAYRYTDRIFFRLLFKFNSQSMDFVSGESVNQKTFSVAPSVMYYF